MAGRGRQRRHPTAVRTGRPVPPSRGPARPAPSPARRRPRPAPSASPLVWLSRSPLGKFSDWSGIPGWASAVGALVWIVMLLLWATGAVKGSFAVFLAALLSAAIATGLLAASVARDKGALRGTRAVGLIVLAAAVPVVFDPHTGDVFNLPKYTIVVLGALVLAGLWVVAGVHDRAAPRWRNGLQWVVAALVLWTAVSALAGMDTRVSLLGNYGSYDGLYSAAAFGVIMMTVAEAFDVADVRKTLGAMAFAGGTLVVLYGLVQLHDNEVHGARWDFISWNLGSFSDDIFSTFGNPNHLGGYLAMLLPVVLVLGLGARRWAWRVPAGLLALALLTELLRTSARGAWVAAAVSLVLLAVMLLPELKRRPLLSASGTAGVVVVAAVLMAAEGKRFLSHSLSTLFQSGGTTSVEQRFQIWRAALHMAVDHPIVGIGPDVFALVYPRYQSASWVAGLGPNYLVNGAHDIFMTVLADQGFIGLALFLALLALIGLRSAGAWRRLRSTERDESVGPEAKERARAHRVAVAVVTASITAYIVQAAFNVQQVGLSFVFWVLVGMLAALALDAGVPDTLHPGAILASSPGTASSPGAGAVVAGPGSTGPAGTRTRPGWSTRQASGRRRPGGRRDEVPWPSLVATMVALAIVILLGLGADAPYRADHDYWAAYNNLKQSNPTGQTSAPTTVGATYFQDMTNAMNLNPCEPTYPDSEATVLIGAAGHASSSAQTTNDLVQARDLLAKAVAEKPLWAPYAASAVEVEVQLANYQPSSAKADLTAAVSLARQAVRDNPRDTEYRTLLTQALANLQKASAKH